MNIVCLVTGHRKGPAKPAEWLYLGGPSRQWAPSDEPLSRATMWVRACERCGKVLLAASMRGHEPWPLEWGPMPWDGISGSADFTTELSIGHVISIPGAHGRSPETP